MIEMHILLNMLSGEFYFAWNNSSYIFRIEALNATEV